MDKELLQKVEAFVTNYYKENETEKLVYHDISHTNDVVKGVEKIGVGCDVAVAEMELLLLAAWFHDTGYTVARENHENISVDIATSFLTESNYPPDKIEKVKSLILATKIFHTPKNLLEEVICDADLLHLGKKNFIVRNEWLKLELEKCEGTSLYPKKWNEETIKFMVDHKYYTQYAHEKYTKKKLENIGKLNKQREKIDFKMDSDKFKEDKLQFEKQKLKEKMESSGKSDRGIETMFRNVIRTHVEFSGMADNKANIMISVNTLVLTAIVAILSPKLDIYTHLIIPTIILTVVSLSTLIVATLVTRPKITGGVFTEDDIYKKRTNLLFFGNFYKMDLEKFTWGMKEMMRDKEFLYSNMIMDFYYLGQVLGKKYKYLNICFGIFIYGMVISVLAFGIAVIFFGDSQNIGGPLFRELLR